MVIQWRLNGDMLIEYFSADHVNMSLFFWGASQDVFFFGRYE